MKTKTITLAFLAVTAGVCAYARQHNPPPSDLRDAAADVAPSGDFNGLQTSRTADIAVLAESGKAAAPVPKSEIVVSEKADARIKTAVLKISGYADKELSGKLLNAKELADLTAQLNFLAALPGKDIPVELLGYLEGISLSLQELLPKGPVGRDIGPALKAARALQSKVAALGRPEKAKRGGVAFAVGAVSIKIETLNFTLGAISANLACRFKDGSGAAESRPEQELAVKVSGDGKIRQVDISAGRLAHFGLFTSPKSCRYILNVRSSVGNSGDFTLAGSMFNMTREELDALLSDTGLNERISAQNQPLRLIERNGYITKPGAAQ